MPELERLARLTRETTGLGVLDGDTLLTVAQADGPNLIAVGDWTGRSTPLHCVASGKVLLAALAEREVLRIVRRGLVAYTERTITELEPLLEELARIRRRGYATAIGEYELGLNAVAAPVHDARGNVIAAVDIWGPAFRLTPRRIPELAAQAREAAAAISVRLGGTAARATDAAAGLRHGLTLRPSRARATLSACPTWTSRPGATSSTFVRTDVPADPAHRRRRVRRAAARPLFVHGIVKTLLDREATEGTAQELSRRRGRTSGWTRSTPCSAAVVRFFIVVDRRPHDPGRSSASTSGRPSPASGSSASRSASAPRASSATTSTAP